jgi:hypothetical protein
VLVQDKEKKKAELKAAAEEPKEAAPAEGAAV